MNTKKKGIIAYYSRSGENYVSGKIVHLTVGNTEVVAQKISELTGFDLFKIDTREPYPTDYKETTRIALREHKESFYPEMKEPAPDLSAYDIVYLGYPNWWSTFPMVVGRFLQSVSLAGKTVVPFCTHEGSGMCGIPEIEEFCPAVIIGPELVIKGSQVHDSDELIRKWVEKTR